MRRLVLAILGLAVTGCASSRDEAEKLAAAGGMRPVLVRTDSFVLAAQLRLRDPAQPLVVYIEGDGRAWLNRSTPSSDPTPRAPVALWLAARDPAPNVAYLARPCQYTARQVDPACSTPRYWTGYRFAEEVIAATNQAIDQLKGGGQGGVHLVGYSGGAAVAALVTARRDDVLSLRTVAGNLDNDTFNRLHEVSPMPNSLNAAHVAARLAALPQLHLVGARDEVVPRAVVDSYLSAMGPSACVRMAEIPGASHEGPWEEAWARQPAPSCR